MNTECGESDRGTGTNTPNSIIQRDVGADLIFFGGGCKVGEFLCMTVKRSRQTPENQATMRKRPDSDDDRYSEVKVTDRLRAAGGAHTF